MKPTKQRRDGYISADELRRMVEADEDAAGLREEREAFYRSFEDAVNCLDRNAERGQR